MLLELFSPPWHSHVCFPNFKGDPPLPPHTHTPKSHPHPFPLYIYISCNVMYHKREFITCHYLSLWHLRWYFDPQRGHFTALDFSVYVCTWCSFCLYQLPPRDKSVCHSDNSVHHKALNPTQHWLNLLSNVLFISITTVDSFGIKFTCTSSLFS